MKIEIVCRNCESFKNVKVSKGCGLWGKCKAKVPIWITDLLTDDELGDHLVLGVNSAAKKCKYFSVKM
jgi:hypothetical protein